MTGGRLQPTDEVLSTVLAGHDDVAEGLEEVHEAAWRATDPVLLELCRLRMAMLLGCEVEVATRTPAAAAAGLEEQTIAELAAFVTSTRFGARERACLAFCEQFVIDASGMTDELAGAVVEHLGPGGCRDFVTALLVVEQRMRMRLAWERIFGGRAA